MVSSRAIDLYRFTRSAGRRVARFSAWTCWRQQRNVVLELSAACGAFTDVKYYLYGHDANIDVLPQISSRRYQCEHGAWTMTPISAIPYIMYNLSVWLSFAARPLPLPSVALLPPLRVVLHSALVLLPTHALLRRYSSASTRTSSATSASRSARSSSSSLRCCSASLLTLSPFSFS